MVAALSRRSDDALDLKAGAIRQSDIIHKDFKPTPYW
jgi:hypothetical protein